MGTATADTTETMEVKPIGKVRNGVTEPTTGGWGDVVSRLEVDEEYGEGLRGLADYSHVTVLYWLSLVDSCTLTHVPQGRDDVPEVGIFACRCPTRPNPIGISTAELLKIEGNVLTVRGLDAIDETPIIDIKPYTPQYDLRGKVRVPTWVDRLEY